MNKIKPEIHKTRFLILLVAITFTCSAQCRVEYYSADLSWEYVEQGYIIEKQLNNFEVVLDEFEKKNVDINGQVVERNGRCIHGDLFSKVFKFSSKQVHFHLKRILFGKNYKGRFTTFIKNPETGFNDRMVKGVISLKRHL